MAKSITSPPPAESLQTLLEREAAPFSTEESVALLVALAEQVDALHDSGKLHRAISAELVVLDSSSTGVLLLPGPAEPVLLGGPAADQGQTPPELDRTEAVPVPADLDSARQLLARRGINFDPVRIDLFQLGTLLVRLVAGESASDYLRSPRAKRKVSPAVRPLIDGALGYEPEKRFASVIQLSEAAGTVLARLLETAAKPTAAMAPDTDGASGQSSKQDTDLSIVAEATSDTSMAPPRRAETGRSDLPFRRLAHYEILERIGRGGMGDVFKGYERVLDRTVAIKVLPDELSRQDDFVRRFHAEASAAARMIHPNIIQIHFIGEEAGHHFFAMQYVEGESLAELLARRRKLSVEETLAIVEQALSGLAAAHRMGMVHRDIKPGNILLDRENRRALLADFGLVKSVEQDGGGMTATGVVMGTVDYIAPEQGRGHSVDNRADLYSVGVLMYQMLSGRLPFMADSPTAMIFQHVYERPPALVDVASDVPAELSAIVARLLAKSPDERYQSAEAVLDDLRAFREGRPLAHGQESAVEQPATAQGTVIIEAPRFDDILLPSSVAAATAPNWWDDAKERFLSIFQRHAPEFLQELQSTGQQIDGALREYEGRRDHLRELIGEADAVLSELEAQATSYREAAEVAAQRAQSATGETAAADYRREKFDCEQMVAELEGLIAQQRDQTEQMQLRLAQVSGRLEQLRSQRDILNARLKAAQARLQIAGGKVTSRERSPIATILNVLACTVFFVFVVALLLPTTVAYPWTSITLALLISAGAALAALHYIPHRAVRVPAALSLLAAGIAVAGMIFGDSRSEVPIGPATRVGSSGTSEVTSPSAQAGASALAPLPGAVDLLTLIDPATDSVIGDWRLENGVLVSPVIKGQAARLQIPFTPPDEYVLTLEVERKTNNETLVLGLLAGGVQGMASLDGWGSTASGLNLDGREANDNETTRRGLVLTRGRPNIVVATVRRDGIRVTADGKVIIDWTGSPERLWVEPGWIVPGDTQLFLGTWESEYRFSRLELTPLPGDTPVTDAAAGLVRTFSGHEDEVRGVAFSPDGRRIASASWDGTARVWDAQTGRELRHFTSPRELRAVSFSPDGTRLLFAGNLGTAYFYDLHSGRELARLNRKLATADLGEPADSVAVESAPIWALASSPDGRRIVTGDQSGHVTAWNLDSGRRLWNVKPYDEFVYSVQFSPDGQRVLTSGRGTSVYELMSANGREAKAFKDFNQWVLAAAFSPDGKYILAGGHEWAPRLIDERNHQESRRLVGPRRSTYCVAFSHDGRLAAAAGFDGIVRVWDVETGKQVCQFSGHEDKVWSIAFSPDDRFVASGSADRTVRLWRLPDASEQSLPVPQVDRADLQQGAPDPRAHQIRSFAAHTGRVFATTFSPDGTHIATAGEDGAIRLWDRVTGEQRFNLLGHSGPVTAAVYSPDGARLVSVGADKSVRVWSTVSGAEVQKVQVPDEATSVAWSPNRKKERFATAGRDGTVRIWDGVWWSTGEMLHELDGHGAPARAVAFSPDGSRLASGDSDGSIIIWNLDSAQQTRRLANAQGVGVLSVAFSPDGRRLAAGNIDGTSTLWNVETGKEIRRYEGHTEPVSSVEFSADGRYLVTGASQSDASDAPRGAAVRIWDAEIGRELLALDPQTDGTTAVDFSPVSLHAVSADWNGHVRLWDVGAALRESGHLTKAADENGTAAQPARSQEPAHGPSVTRKENTVTYDLGLLKPADAPKDYSVYIPQNAEKVEVGFYLGGHEDGTSPNPGYQGWLAINTDRVLKWQGYQKQESGPAIYYFENKLTGQRLSSDNMPGDWLDVTQTTHPGENIFRYFHYQRLGHGMRVRIRLGENSSRPGITLAGIDSLLHFGHSTVAHDLSASTDGQSVLVAGGPVVYLLEPETGRIVQEFWGHVGNVRSVALSHDGQRVASGGDDYTIRIWDARTGQELKKLEGHAWPVLTLDFSPDSRQLLSGSDGLRLWDLETGEQLQEIRIPDKKETVWTTAFFSDGRRALTGSWDGTVRVWNLETGEELKTLAGHTGRVKSVGLSPDERLAVSCATEDPVIRLWDVEKGEVIRTFEGHRAGVASVAFSPDGKWLLSGGGLQQPANGGFLDIDPRHIRLWNVSTGEMLRELGSHGSSVVDIAFVGDGGQAISCGAEGTVQIWALPTATEQ